MAILFLECLFTMSTGYDEVGNIVKSEKEPTVASKMHHGGIICQVAMYI
jgi:hypothetical protein